MSSFELQTQFVEQSRSVGKKCISCCAKKTIFNHQGKQQEVLDGQGEKKVKERGPTNPHSTCP